MTTRCIYCKRHVPTDTTVQLPTTGRICRDESECVKVFWERNPMADNPSVGDLGDE